MSKILHNSHGDDHTFMQEMGPTWMDLNVLTISGLLGRDRLHRRSRQDLGATTITTDFEGG